MHAKPRIKQSACSRTAVVRPYLSACFGPSSGQFGGIISCLARVRARKVCGDVPHTQGNVCASFVHVKPRIKHGACSRTAVVQPYLSACFGSSSGQFGGIISYLARVRVRKLGKRLRTVSRMKPCASRRMPHRNALVGVIVSAVRRRHEEFARTCVRK